VNGGWFSENMSQFEWQSAQWTRIGNRLPYPARYVTPKRIETHSHFQKTSQLMHPGLWRRFWRPESPGSGAPWLMAQVAVSASAESFPHEINKFIGDLEFGSDAELEAFSGSISNSLTGGRSARSRNCSSSAKFKSRYSSGGRRWLA
jgi:hypothetical protein